MQIIKEFDIFAFNPQQVNDWVISKATTTQQRIWHPTKWVDKLPAYWAIPRS